MARLIDILQQSGTPTNTNTMNQGQAGGGSLLQILQASGIQPKIQTPEEKQEGFFSGLAKSIIRPFARTGVTAGNLLQSTSTLGAAGLAQLSGKKTLAQRLVGEAGQEASQSRNLPFLGETKPVTSPMESIGTGLEIGTTVSPVGRGLGFAKKLGKFALEGGLFETGRQMEEKEKFDLGSIATSAITGTAIPVAGKALKGLTKVSAKYAGELLGKTTGTGFESIKQAFNNPNTIKYVRMAGKTGVDDLLDDTLKTTDGIVTKIAGEAGNAYRNSLDKIKMSKVDETAILDNLKNKTKELFNERNVKILSPSEDEVGRMINQLDFGESTIVNNENVVQRAFNQIFSWTDTSPAGLDMLKKRINTIIDNIPERNSPAKTMLYDISDTLTKDLKFKIPGYQDMTKEYSKYLDFKKEINDVLALGKGKKKETQLRKLLQSLRTNGEVKLKLLEQLEKEGQKEILPKLAGAQLSEKMPRGLAGVLTPTTGVVGSFLAPSIIPHLLTMGIITSPRAVAEIVNVLGKVTKEMVKANKFTPEVEKTIRIIIQNMIAETKKKTQNKTEAD